MEAERLWEGRRWAQLESGLTLCVGFDIRAASLTKGQSDFGVSSLRPALLVKMLWRATAKQMLVS